MKIFSVLKNGLLLILLSSTSLIFSFSYDSAIYAAQKGDWQDAHATLSGIITNNPDDADVLHDAGVAAYKLGNTSQAKACFLRCAECAHNDDLRFNAYFKAGNACVDDKDLQGALEQYDKALVIKPYDEYARHNRDRVEQMLQEQEKQQEQQKENDQKEDQQENQENNDQDKQDQNQDNQSGNDKDQQQGNDPSSAKACEDRQKNQQGNDQQGQNKKENGSNQQSQGDQGNDANNGDKDAQRKEQGNKQQREKQPANKQERNGEQELDKKSDSAEGERDKQQGNKHNKAPEKQNETDDKNNVASAGAQEQGKDDDKHGGIGIDDPWLLNILNNQEEQDKSINKQLMEARVRQHGGKNGQNCW